VTEGVPRSLEVELSTINDVTGALVQVDQLIAHDDIRKGADLLTMIAVYKEKSQE
jgi:hypothetical protein